VRTALYPSARIRTRMGLAGQLTFPRPGRRPRWRRCTFGAFGPPSRLGTRIIGAPEKRPGTGRSWIHDRVHDPWALEVLERAVLAARWPAGHSGLSLENRRADDSWQATLRGRRPRSAPVAGDVVGVLTLGTLPADSPVGVFPERRGGPRRDLSRWSGTYGTTLASTRGHPATR